MKHIFVLFIVRFISLWKEFALIYFCSAQFFFEENIRSETSARTVDLCIECSYLEAASVLNSVASVPHCLIRGRLGARGTKLLRTGRTLFRMKKFWFHGPSSECLAILGPNACNAA